MNSNNISTDTYSLVRPLYTTQSTNFECPSLFYRYVNAQKLKTQTLHSALSHIAILRFIINHYKLRTSILECAHSNIYFCRSLESYLATPLDQNLSKVFTSCLNPALPTVVYTFGYRGRSNGPATKAVLEAYIKRKKRNVILLDWEEEAKSGVLGIPLGYAFHAVPNAKKVSSMHQ